MIRLFRTGFWRDFTGLILLTIVIGSLIAGGVSLALDRYFSGTVSSLVGEFGEYDIIVHVREEAREAAWTAFRRLARERLGNPKLKAGITVAGKANFFLSVPTEARNQQVFESLGTWLSELPGYAGTTMIAEPSVVLRNVHPSVRTALARELAVEPGVDFVFRDGSSLVAMLRTPADTQAVLSAAEKLAAKHRILEVRFPFAYRLDNPEQAASEVERALEEMWGKGAARDVTVAGKEDEMGSFVTALGEMKRFLVGYATQVQVALIGAASVKAGDTLELVSSADGSQRVTMRVTGVSARSVQGYVERGDATPLLSGEVQAFAPGNKREALGSATLTNERLQLVEAIDASLELLAQLSNLSQDADGAVRKAEETLKTFEAALVQLDIVQEQVRQINEEITTKGQADAGEVLLSVLLSSLVRKVQPQAKSPDLQAIDVPGMQASLRDMAERLEAMSRVDMDVIAREVRQVRDNLPQLTDTEIGDSLRLIDSYLDGQVVPGDQIQLLLSPAVDVEQSEALIRGVLDREDATLFTSPGAVVTPDARATLFSVLGQVRQVIAGITALVWVLFVLVLDHATLFTALRLLWEQQRKNTRRLRFWHPARWLSDVDLWAMGTASVLLGGVYAMSGAAIPGLNLGHVLLIGALMGLIVGRLSRRISPVDSDEVVAGIALGMSETQVMREIVVPAGRPGMMWLLNRRRQIFA